MEELATNIKREGLGHVCRFTGTVPYEEMPLYIGAFDIGLAPLFPDLYKPLNTYGFFFTPAKIFEYMAARKPVITADISPMNSIVRNEREGLLVHDNDVEGYAENISILVENDALREKMGMAGGRRLRDTFHWNNHSKQHA